MSLQTCLRCHVSGEPTTKHVGSFVGEMVIWVIAILLAFNISWLFLLAAFVFTLVRFFSGKTVCKTCGSTELVPYNSPAARNLRPARSADEMNMG